MRNATIFIMLFSALAISSCGQGSDNYHNIGVEEFQQKMAEVEGTVLDVRTPGEVSQGVIENAVHIDIYDVDFAERAAKLDKEKPVYVYCRSGGRSSKAGHQLAKMGFKEVYNLDGGIMAWDRAGNKKVKLQE